MPVPHSALPLVALLAWTSSTAAEGVGEPIDYGRDIRPILAARCFTCHGPDASSREAKLRLDDPHDAKRTRDDGVTPIAAGDPHASEALLRVLEEDPDLRMPPEGEALTAREIDLLTRWIEEGAVYNEAWSWRAIDPQPPPEVSDATWAKDPLDRFVLARLEEHGLAPASAAEPRTLLRRVSFDLTGLPPSPEDLDRFAADPSREAFAREVDRLLASPAFGERWGRHWLDLVRYAETHGHEFDYPIPHAWRYRDAVIAAFNDDVPYDRFLTEHLAGDLIEQPRLDAASGLDQSRILTGFWWLSQGTHAPVDVAMDEADRIDNQIDVLSKAFLGVTASCARCHDHKFDAITQADYYGLSAHLKVARRAIVELDPHGEIARAREESLLARRTLERSILADAALRAESRDDDPAEAGLELLEDFATPLPQGFSATGLAFARSIEELPLLEIDAESVRTAPIGLASSRAPGERFAGTLRSPSFEIVHRHLHQRIRGKGTARVIVDGYFLDERNALLFEGFKRGIDSPQAFVTASWDLDRYRGHRAYLEWIDEGEGFLEIDWVATSDDASPPPIPEETIVAVESTAQQRAALSAAGTGQSPSPVRVLATEDGTPWVEHVRLRGDPRRRGEPVGPGHLASLDGDAARPADRLALAQRMIEPDHPLTARVMANRIWHHLLGRGIVESVDDFGALGSPPSDPALLDHLADRLRADWSIKRLVRAIVLSNTYAMSIAGDPRGEAIDPLNEIPHRANLRRLDAESLRDALIVLSGRFDPAMGGPGIPTHLTEFMDGRGRPGQSGPLDGAGRRSVYLEVRRNFPDPFLQAFDLPIPTTTIGRRNRSNVPAQALAMLNAPLVHLVADAWGARIAAMPADDAARLSRMFEESLGRPPRSEESEACLAFLGSERAIGVDAPEAWAALAHVLLNTKEFLFLQ